MEKILYTLLNVLAFKNRIEYLIYLFRFSFFGLVLLLTMLFCESNKQNKVALPFVYISEPLYNRQNGFEKKLIHDKNCSVFFQNHFSVKMLKPDHLTDLSELKNITHLDWQIYNTQDSVVNLSNIFPGVLNKVVYIAEIIEVDIPQTRILSFGSDDGIIIWCNGDSLITVHRGRAVSRNDDFVQINLRKGHNILFYKIDQGDGDWGLYRKLLSEKESVLFFKQNAALVYSDILESYILPDSAKSIVLRKETRHRYDHEHQVFFKWKQLNGKVFNINSYLPKSIPDRIALPLNFNGLALLDIEIYTKDSALVYTEEAPVLLNSVSALLTQKLLKHKLTDPVGIARSEGLKKIWYSDSARYSTRMKAHLLIDLYRYINHKNINSRFHGAQVWAYKSSVDGSMQPYRIFIPSSYNPSESYPVTFITHGLFDKEQDFWESIEGGSHRYLVWRTTLSTENQHILVMPHGRGIENYLGKAKEEIPLIIKQLKNNWNIDTTHITIFTYSKGARNLLLLMSQRSLPITIIAFVGPIIYEDETSLYSLLLKIKERYPNINWYIRHGMNDSVSPIYLTRKLVNYLKSLNFKVDYKELPHSNHFSHLIDPEREFYQAQNKFFH